jgi:hypothetical protein
VLLVLFGIVTAKCVEDSRGQLGVGNRLRVSGENLEGREEGEQEEN